MNSSQRYEEAIRLIKSNQLEKARDVLMPIRHEERAAQWIQKIEARFVQTESVVETPERQLGTPSATGSRTATAGPPGSEAAVSETKVDEDATGKWSYDYTVSALDDSENRFLVLTAEASAESWLGSVSPALVIRCQHCEYDVFIDIGTQVESTVYDEVFVRVRYGKDEPVKLTMQSSTTGKGMFFRDARKALRALLSVNRFVIEFTPFNSNPVVAIFDLTGLEEAAQPLFEAVEDPELWFVG